MSPDGNEIRGMMGRSKVLLDFAEGKEEDPF